MITKKLTPLLFVMIFVVFFSGCASSAKVILKAEQSSVPISLSEGYYDKQNHLLLKEHYQVVHHFAIVYHKFSLSRFSGAKQVHLEQKLLPLVQEHNGDAIVNLRVRADPADEHLEGLRLLTGWVTFSLVMPSRIRVTVTGDIVKKNLPSVSVSNSQSDSR